AMARSSGDINDQHGNRGHYPDAQGTIAPACDCGRRRVILRANDDCGVAHFSALLAGRMVVGLTKEFCGTWSGSEAFRSFLSPSGTSASPALWLRCSAFMYAAMAQRSAG